MCRLEIAGRVPQLQEIGGVQREHEIHLPHGHRGVGRRGELHVRHVPDAGHGHAAATAHRVAAAAAANQLALWRRRRQERRRGDTDTAGRETAARRGGVDHARRLLVGGRPERQRQHGGPCFEPRGRGGRLLLDRRLLVAGVRGGALGARVGAVVHDVEEQRVAVRALHLLARLAALRVPVRAPEVGSARIGWSPWGSINRLEKKMTKNR